MQADSPGDRYEILTGFHRQPLKTPLDSMQVIVLKHTQKIAVNPREPDTETQDTAGLLQGGGSAHGPGHYIGTGLASLESMMLVLPTGHTHGILGSASGAEPTVLIF